MDGTAYGDGRKSASELRGIPCSRNFLDFPQRHLFDRIGARSMVLETDAWGNFIITGFDYGSTRDWARFGLLHLRDGVWEGERILPEGWTDFVRTSARPTSAGPTAASSG